MTKRKILKSVVASFVSLILAGLFGCGQNLGQNSAGSTKGTSPGGTGLSDRVQLEGQIASGGYLKVVREYYKNDCIVDGAGDLGGIGCKLKKHTEEYRVTLDSNKYRCSLQYNSKGTDALLSLLEKGRDQKFYTVFNENLKSFVTNLNNRNQFSSSELLTDGAKISLPDQGTLGPLNDGISVALTSIVLDIDSGIFSATKKINIHIYEKGNILGIKVDDKGEFSCQF